MVGILPDAWKETCKIAIIASNASPIEFTGMTEDITAMDWTEKDIEGMQLVNGGRVVKYNAMTDESMTIKVYDTKADDAATNSAVQYFHKQATADTTQPIAVDNVITRQKFGIVILWAETLPATATALPDTDKTAYRIQIINAYMTSYKPSFDDKLKSAEITFKWPPLAKDATANKREESTDGSVQLPAAITTSTSF
jgi:hypothetical protein